jgi:exodeoxyribonuclease V alpha subunit
MFAQPPGSPALPDWQLAATITAALQQFTIITGGPGTGKTTTVARLLALLYRINPDLDVALAAPTGKASARMAESLRSAHIPGAEDILPRLAALKPTTLHRLLGPIRNSPYFRHNADLPLRFDVLIIDECSMIDMALFSKTLDAIGPDTRLILLGDKDQLAAVEAGSIFGDLCNAQEQLNNFSPDHLEIINSFIPNTERQIPHAHATEDPALVAHPLFGHIVSLKYSRRFRDDEGIGRFSQAMITGNEEAIKEYISALRDHSVVLDTAMSDTFFHEFIAGYKAYIHESDIATAFKAFNALRVLCAVREGDTGLYKTNLAIELWLQKQGYINVSAQFYEHRPLLITANNPELDLLNGDVGLIRKNSEGQLIAWFQQADGTPRSVAPGYLHSVETAFALTIHKSQGSEFDSVLVRLPAETDNRLLTRELVYTAVTRARKRVVLQATAEALLAACRARVSRSSGIESQLRREATTVSN